MEYNPNETVTISLKRYEQLRAAERQHNALFNCGMAQPLDASTAATIFEELKKKNLCVVYHSVQAPELMTTEEAKQKEVIGAD